MQLVYLPLPDMLLSDASFPLFKEQTLMQIDPKSYHDQFSFIKGRKVDLSNSNIAFGTLLGISVVGFIVSLLLYLCKYKNANEAAVYHQVDPQNQYT